MTSMGATDATQCRPFPLTLSNQAYRWFKSWAPNSIDSFHQLVSLFLNHFVNMVPRPASKQIFANIRQGPMESNRDYIKWVDKLILEGEHTGDEVKVMGAVRGA